MVHLAHVHAIHVHLRVIHLAHVHAIHVHARHIHTTHIHRTHIHAHIIHGQIGNLIHCRYGCGQVFIRCQRATRKSRAIDRLGKNGVGSIICGFNDNVIGFRYAETYFIHADRFYILAISSNHGHFQPGYAHIKKGHGRAIDEAQANLFALAEQGEPAIVWRYPVHQIGIGITGNVRQIALTHAHFTPHGTFGPGGGKAFLFNVRHQVLISALFAIVIITELFQLGVDIGGIFIRPVGQHDDIIPVEGKWL